MRSYKHICDDIENVENYEKALADDFKGWVCHHRLETHNSDGERRLVDIAQKELEALDMYYHRPANELIFLTSSEHTSLHQKGKPKSEEQMKHLAEVNKGKHRSEETKRKIGEAHKDKKLSEETKRKIREGNKGKHSGFLSEEHKRKIAETMEGRKRGPYLMKMHHWKLGDDGKRVYY